MNIACCSAVGTMPNVEGSVTPSTSRLRRMSALICSCSDEVLEDNLIPILQVYGLRLHALDVRFFHMLRQMAMESRQVFESGFQLPVRRNGGTRLELSCFA